MLSGVGQAAQLDHSYRSEAHRRIFQRAIDACQYSARGGRGENKTPQVERRVVRQRRECSGFVTGESSSSAKHRAPEILC